MSKRTLVWQSLWETVDWMTLHSKSSTHTTYNPFWREDTPHILIAFEWAIASVICSYLGLPRDVSISLGFKVIDLKLEALAFKQEVRMWCAWSQAIIMMSRWSIGRACGAAEMRWVAARPVSAQRFSQRRVTHGLARWIVQNLTSDSWSWSAEAWRWWC